MQRDRVSTRLPLGFLPSAAATAVWLGEVSWARLLGSVVTSSRFDLEGVFKKL